MTISNQTTAIEYVGNGATTLFPFPFAFNSPSHIFVTKVTIASDFEDPLDSSEYTLAGTGAEGSGSITVTPAISALYRLRIERTVPYTQPMNIQEQGAFLAEVVEDQFDLVTMQIQQVAYELHNEIEDIEVGSATLDATLTSLAALSLLPGDVLYAPAPETLQRLPVGTEGQYIKVVSGLPTWSTGGSGFGSDSYTPPSAIDRTIDGKLDEYVSFTDFYVSSDGDYTEAWGRFGVWARAQNALGKGTELYLPPGEYPFDHGLSWGSLWGIQRLLIRGYGATVTNTYAGANFGYQMAFHAAGSIPNSVTIGFKINSAIIGATTVTLKTPAETSNFTVGASMLIGSLDVQGYGQPANLDRFDFARITAINAGTGVITFSPPIRNYHRDDFPDWQPTPVGASPMLNLGKARVYRLDNAFYLMYNTPAARATVPWLGAADFPVPWALEHRYEGFTISVSAYPQLFTGGQTRTYTNMRLPGLSESVMQRGQGNGCFFVGQGEADKIVDNLVYDSCIWDTRYDLQSSSINNVTFRNSRCPQMNAGTVKSFYAENCDFDSWLTGALYGRGRGRTLIGCRVGSMGDQAPYPLDKTLSDMVVDGVNITYANGVFTMLKSASNIYFNLMPGSACHWQAISVGYSGDYGSFYVTRVYDDVNYIYMETTCPFTVTPAWALSGGSARIKCNRNGQVSFIQCYGGDHSNRLTEATIAGQRHGEYYRDTFMGQWDQSGFWSGRAGILRRIVMDVKQTCAVAGSKIELGIQVVDTATLLIAGAQALDIHVDLTVKGKRDWDLTALTGKVGIDVCNLAGVAQTFLPANRLCTGNQINWFTRNIATGAIATYLMPVVEIEMYFDGGIYLQPLVAYAAHQGVTGKMALTVGTHFP